MNDISLLLTRMDADPTAAEQLLPLVYEELRNLANAKLAREKPGQTLQTTALVHEAYLRLVDQTHAPSWNCRGHFFAAAAEAMRRILVERARRKLADRHGGKHRRIDMAMDAIADEFDVKEADRILTVHESLNELSTTQSRQAKLVELRFFAGMALEEAASLLEISLATAKRDWAAARVWLARRLANDDEK